MTNGKQTMSSVNAASAIELNAKINPAKPIVDKQMDKMSILAWIFHPRVLFWKWLRLTR